MKKYNNNDVDERRIKTYLDARSQNSIDECFRGDQSYKINDRSSYFSSITDIDVLIEHCLYPLYTTGDIQVKKETEEVLKNFSTSNRILDIYQFLTYLTYQREDVLINKSFAFKIEFQTMIPDLIKSYLALDRETFQVEDEKLMLDFIDRMVQSLQQKQAYRRNPLKVLGAATKR